jgi:protocatechuate 3,4-dioxygenase beta subunit
MTTYRASRRAVLGVGLAGAGDWFLGCHSRENRPAADAGATRVCQLTESNIEGPYYLAGAPVRRRLADAASLGTRLSLRGRVLSSRCEPLGGARLEVWHADHRGAYDLRGYSFRASVIAAADGSFVLDTIVPGRYLNGQSYRPAHIHFKLQAAAHQSLTTQLYFAGDPYNKADPFIRRSLIVRPRSERGVLTADYDFVLASS